MEILDATFKAFDPDKVTEYEEKSYDILFTILKIMALKHATPNIKILFQSSTFNKVLFEEALVIKGVSQGYAGVCPHIQFGARKVVK